MPSEDLEMKSEVVEDGIKDMEIKSGASSDDEALGTIRVSSMKEESVTPTGAPSPSRATMKSKSHSPVKSRKSSLSPTEEKAEHNEEVIGGEITVKMEPGQIPKLARSASQKIMARPAPLFDDLPDKTMEARDTFQVIPQCIYAAKYLGSTEHAMECDCAEEWGKPF